MEHKPETILAAAVGVFRDQGVNVSTAKVAKAAGVSNGTLFNYFPTKQDLLDQLYVSLKADMAAALGEIDRTAPLPDQLRTIWDRWIHWAQNNRDAHEVMNLLHQSGLASDDAQTKGAELFAPVAEIMMAADAAGLFVDLPMSYLSAIIQVQLDQAITAELDNQQLAIAYDVMWNGITR